VFVNLCYEPLLYFKKITGFLAGLNPVHAIYLLGAARLTTTNADAQQKYSSRCEEKGSRKISQSHSVANTVPLPTAKPSPQASPKAPTPKPTPRQVVTPVTSQPVLPAGQPPDAAYASMLPSLQSIFEVSKSDSYSSRLLYKLKKSSFTGYLNLVPIKDGTGTIVVLWAEPKSVICFPPHSYQSFTEIRLFKQQIFIQRLLTYIGIRT
jgi:hypothetical protein